MTELRKDPVVGRWVIISTERAKRPHDFPPEPDPRRPGYGRVDLHARYLWRTGSRQAPQVALTGKVQNLLNRDYEERKGYPAPGINFLLGAELSI